MEYVFGTKRDREVLKTKGSIHTNLKGYCQVIAEYPDQIITDNFCAIRKYQSAEDAEGNCYDWYEIKDHYRYIDKYSPNIGRTEAQIEDLENGICEESMVTEERLADIENALCELSDVVFSE